MSKHFLTVKEVASIVDAEGLGYALTDYLDHTAIENPELADAVMDAAYHLRRVDRLLDELIREEEEG